MKATMALGMGFATVVMIAGFAHAGGPTEATVTQAAFDVVEHGSLPAGWKVEATNPRGKLAA